MSPPGLTLLLKFSLPLTVSSSVLGTKCISQSLPHVWNIIMLHTCLFHWIPVKFFLPCYFSYTPRATKVQIFVNGVLALKTTECVPQQLRVKVCSGNGTRSWLEWDSSLESHELSQKVIPADFLWSQEEPSLPSPAKRADHGQSTYPVLVTIWNY